MQPCNEISDEYFLKEDANLSIPAPAFTDSGLLMLFLYQLVFSMELIHFAVIYWTKSETRSLPLIIAISSLI